MCPSWPLKMASLRWRPQLETLIWVGRTLTTAWWITLLKNSRGSTRRTSVRTRGPWGGCGQHVSEPREPSLPALRPALRSTLCTRASTSTRPSPERALKRCAQTSSEEHLSLWEKPWETPRWTSLRSMTLCWLEDQQESQRSRSFCRISSTAETWTRASTQMRQWLMVLRFKPPSSWETHLETSRTCCCWTWLHCPWVLKPQVESWRPSSNATPPSPANRPRPSAPTQTTSPVSWSRSTRERGPWQKTTTCWVNLSWQESHLLHVESRRSKWPLTSMPTES